MKKKQIWIFFGATLMLFLMLTISCKKKENNNNPNDNSTTIAIGNSYAGGIVFFIDSTGQHGFVCAPNDFNYSTECQAAIYNCDDLLLNGYEDWHLPTKELLNLMYVNLRKNSKGNFLSTDYWSSTGVNFYFAWSQNFGDGSQNQTRTTDELRYRAYRAF